ncbi:MAG: immunity 17 family protein [Cyanobacteria bacterium J06639_1]
MEGIFPAILLILAGLFSAAGGFFNWNWFMNSRRARFFSAIMTRTGARIFYVILGLAIAGLGVKILIDVS